MRLLRGIAGVACVVLASGCANTTFSPPPEGTPKKDAGSLEEGIPGLKALHIEPADPVLALPYDTEIKQSFYVLGVFVDGTKRDLTGLVTFSSDNAGLGYLQKNTFYSNKYFGGQTVIKASSGSVTTATTLTLRLTYTETMTGAGNAQKLFDNATDTTGSAPALAYPQDGVLLPPNLDDLAVMWADESNTLWEVAFTNAFTNIRLYTNKPSAKLSGEGWKALAQSNREAEVTLKVRGLHLKNPKVVGESKAIKVHLARQTIEGGIYFFAMPTGFSGDTNIMRHDFGDSTQKAELYYGAKQAGGCVGCHALASDGSQLACNTGTPNLKPGQVVEVKSRKQVSSSYHANFQSYTPDKKYIIASVNGSLAALDGTTGATVCGLDVPGYKTTMPDVSPEPEQGSEFKELRVAFVRVGPGGNFSADWSFKGGEIAVAPLQGTKLGAATTIVPASTSYNNYYPAFSPDGSWVVFNRSTGWSYSDNDANVYMVSSKGGAAVALSTANLGGDLRNSWPRWAPFVHQYKGRKLMWVTFASTRDVGTALINTKLASDKKLPQIWMAAVDVEKAASGKDPSFPAFWLPFQDLASNNHLAQWTKKVVEAPPIDK